MCRRLEPLGHLLQDFDLTLLEKTAEEDLCSLLQQWTSKKDISSGRCLHSSMINHGSFLPIAENHLIRLFAACGTLFEASLVFCTLTSPTVYTWHAIISAHIMYQQSGRAFCLYHAMQQEGVTPNRFIITCILKACGGAGALGQGKAVHDDVIRSGHALDVVVGSSLVDMYAKCGSIREAAKVFDDLPHKDLVSWSAMMEALVQNGCSSSALELMGEILQKGVKPDKVIFLSALKACGCIGSLQGNRLLHEQVVRCGFETDVIVANTLVDVYAKCGSLEDACRLFAGLKAPTVVSWGAMLSGYASNDQGFRALKLLEEMWGEGIEPNEVVLLSALKACSSMETIEHGKLLYHEIIEKGLELDVVIGSSLIDMYCKGGSLEEAHRIFEKLPNRNVVSWGTLIAGYAQCGHTCLASEFFDRMLETGVQPGKITWVCILRAFDDLGFLKQGKMAYDGIVKSGFESDEEINNMLISMYAKCGSLEDGRIVLDRMESRSIVSWSAMIAGYTQHERDHLALEAFQRMQVEDLKPDRVMFLCILKACAKLGAVGQGKLIQDQIIKNSMEADITIGNALIDMYSKCLFLDEARKVFDGLVVRDVITWGAMIAGYAQLADFGLARQCLEDMQFEGLMPNSVVYTSLLSACCQAGKVEEGEYHFNCMSEVHSLSPNVDHLTCMIDLLSGAGYLKEAERLLHFVPKQFVMPGLMSMLTACKVFGNVELGRECFDQVVTLDPNIAAGYILMASIYTAVGRLQDAHTIQELRSQASALKVPGRACIDIQETFKEFVVGDLFDLTLPIAALKNMKQGGYVPQVDFVT